MDFNDDLFDSEIPLAFQRDLVRLIPAVYQSSHASVFGSRAYSEAHYLWPHTRRVDVESGVRDLAVKHGIAARPEPFEGNGDFFSLIETERVICTFSHVDERGSLPRSARARETLAKDPQMKMFEANPEPLPPGTKLYAIIAYGGWSDDVISPTFIDVLFPSRTYKSILGRIPLMERFRDWLGGSGAPIEDIPDTGGPSIRTQPNTKA